MGRMVRQTRSYEAQAGAFAMPAITLRGGLLSLTSARRVLQVREITYNGITMQAGKMLGVFPVSLRPLVVSQSGLGSCGNGGRMGHWGVGRSLC